MGRVTQQIEHLDAECANETDNPVQVTQHCQRAVPKVCQKALSPGRAGRFAVCKMRDDQIKNRCVWNRKIDLVQRGGRHARLVQDFQQLQRATGIQPGQRSPIEHCALRQCAGESWQVTELRQHPVTRYADQTRIRFCFE